jgi:hypothetical protein
MTGHGELLRQDPAGRVIDNDSTRKQLTRILESPAFLSSKRSSKLLRHIVESTMEGRDASLKERSIGIEVFSRNADYDTGEDTVVRTVASDIRRRLALYYGDRRHDDEVRITLPPGAYVPEIHCPREASEESVVVPLVETAHRKTYLGWSLVALFVLAMAATAVVVSVRYSRVPARSSINFNFTESHFLKPALADSRLPLLLCIGRTFSPSRDNDDSLDETFAVLRVARYLTEMGRDFEWRDTISTTVDDLHRQSTFLISSAADPLVSHVFQTMRFHFVTAAGSGSIQIVDLKNPSLKALQVAPPGDPNARSYALLARTFESNNSHWTVSVAGLDKKATIAAADLVMNAKILNDAMKKRGTEWDGKNVEFVVAVETGQTVPTSRVLDIEAW